MLSKFTVQPDGVFLVDDQPIMVISTEGFHLPIRISSEEAEGIRIELMADKTTRPKNHAFAEKAMRQFHYKVSKMVIVGLGEKTFDAALYVESNGSETAIDCSPNFPILAALRYGADLYIKGDVLVEALDSEVTRELIEFIRENKPSAMQ